MPLFVFYIEITLFFVHSNCAYKSNTLDKSCLISSDVIHCHRGMRVNYLLKYCSSTCAVYMYVFFFSFLFPATICVQIMFSLLALPKDDLNASWLLDCCLYLRASFIERNLIVRKVIETIGKYVYCKTLEHWDFWNCRRLAIASWYSVTIVHTLIALRSRFALDREKWKWGWWWHNHPSIYEYSDNCRILNYSRGFKPLRTKINRKI